MIIIKVRLSPEDYERLKYLAMREHRTIPMQATYLVEQAVRKVRIPPPPVVLPPEIDPPEIAELDELLSPDWTL